MAILSMKIKEVTEVIERKIVIESRKMVRDLTETIENGPEIILDTGGKQIGLENKGFPESIIFNQFLFLFIMEIFNRDHSLFNRGAQFEDLLEHFVAKLVFLLVNRQWIPTLCPYPPYHTRVMTIGNTFTQKGGWRVRAQRENWAALELMRNQALAVRTIITNQY